jgi:hypothetical protein
MASKKIVLNRIRTPDGTILTSHTRHDYQTYTDKNGHEYMVDGGNDYLRRSYPDAAPPEELSVHSDAPFEVLRKSYHWGTYRNGVVREWVPVGALETTHLECILNLSYVHPFMKEVVGKELRFRKDGGAPVEWGEPEKKPASKKRTKKVV